MGTWLFFGPAATGVERFLRTASPLPRSEPLTEVLGDVEDRTES